MTYDPSMTDVFATTTQLAARISSSYTVPPDEVATKLLASASELIDYVTMGRAQVAFDTVDIPQALLDALSNAACDQVEFWLEAGEEHDVLGLPKGSSLQGGRVQVQRMPGQLGQRAKRTLIQAGIMWAGVGAV